MIIHMDTFFPKQPPEKEDGNKEYKRYISCNNKSSENDFINRRASQMLYRLIEGDGKAVYLIGVDDDGKVISLNESEIKDTIKYITLISNEINANIIGIRIYKNKVCTIRLQLEKETLDTKLQNLKLY